MPSVLTRSAWKTLHESKDKVRQEKEIEIQNRVKKRLEKKMKSYLPTKQNSKKGKKQILQKFPESESSDDVDEPLSIDHHGDSEVSDGRSADSSGEEDTHCELTKDDFKQGSFIVVDFEGGNRMTQFIHMYV